jgi:hypothetical protein
MRVCPGRQTGAGDGESHAVIAALKFITDPTPCRPRHQTVRAQVFQRRDATIRVAHHHDRRAKEGARRN